MPLLWGILLACIAFLDHTSAYDAVPRWGQASAVVSNFVFINGGKTDLYNSYSYTSAPNTNDVLVLPLDVSFSSSSPPWTLVSSSANSSTAQGPALSWHTISAYNNSQLLLFGGQPGPNSPTVVVNLADSAFIIDVFNRLAPNFISESASWAGEPTRRIYHSAATSIEGLVYIFGGQKADGSNSAFSTHYVFDPRSVLFTLLPTSNGPPDIFGHASIILSDQRILVFGGYCQSQGELLPFSTIWILDTTQHPPSWSTANVSTSSLPSPRRGFVAVLIGHGKILIQGGSDAVLQSNFDDGWILDTTTNPMTWTSVDALTELGPRRDHFAVSSGDQVIFGFGYENSGPAPADLQIYNVSSGSFVPQYTPPAPTATITQTVPLPVSTGSSQSSTKSTGSTETSGGVHPTTTEAPGSSPSETGGGGGTQSGGNNGSNKTTAIALGSALGALTLLSILLLAAWYARRKIRQRHGERQFMALEGNDNDDDDPDSESPHFAGSIPVAGSTTGNNGERRHLLSGILGAIPIVGAAMGGTTTKSRNPRNVERKDMLADEDTREFGTWYDDRRRDGTGGSSWSLRSILTRRMRSREPSTFSTNGTPRREKSDPFTDGASLIRDGETGYIGAVSRPQGRREISYTSTQSRKSYVDPFADPTHEEDGEDFGIHQVYRDEPPFDPYDLDRPSVRPVQPPPPTLRTILPLELGAHTLSPLSERTSQNTLSIRDPNASGSSNAHSSENAPSPFENISQVTSHTSIDSPRSPVLGSTIIGAALSPHQPMRRSDSWWSRFSRTSFIDRRASTSSKRSMAGAYEIRDPNPPPRLVAIQEGNSAGSERTSPKSHRSSSGEQAASRRGSKVHGAHGRSMSSLRTADSEAIERMAGTMDVIQRVRTGSQRTRDSTGSTTGGTSIDEIGGNVSNDAPVASPLEMNIADIASLSSQRAKSPSPAITPPPSSSHETLASSGRPSAGGDVAARIEDFERRKSLDPESPAPTNTKHREERSRKKSHDVTVGYGLAPRQSLYVANPDHRLDSS